MDFLYLGMIFALAVPGGDSIRGARARLLTPELLVFASWLALEVVRNLGVYGLSAFGEFRVRYLVLVVIPYALVFVATREQMLRLARWVVVLFLAVPLACAPLIAVLARQNGSQRTYSASVSMGLFLGLILLLELKRSGQLSVPTPLAVLASLGVAALVLSDAHRSVWIAIVVVGLVLAILGRMPFGRTAPIVIMICVALILVASSGWQSFFTTYEFVLDRSQALIRPLDDGTAAWRLWVWKANLETLRDNPILGHGFGGYWNAYVPELGGIVEVAPHNLYVQTAVKTGIVGLVILLLFFRRMFQMLTRGRRILPSEDGLYEPLILFALAGLFSTLAFGMGYPLDIYGLLSTGLGLAAAAQLLVGVPLE